jgi:hypothetical protein
VTKIVGPLACRQAQSAEVPSGHSRATAIHVKAVNSGGCVALQAGGHGGAGHGERATTPDRGGMIYEGLPVDPGLSWHGGGHL